MSASNPPGAPYVILASKPGQFRTELTDDLEPVETYDYLFAGRRRAEYVIARLLRATRIRVVDLADRPVLNLVPSKFMPQYATLDAARRELDQLMSARALDCALVRRAS